MRGGDGENHFAAIFICVLFSGFVLLVSTVRITDGDTWWHLKTGEIIVAARSLPERDPFSYTTVGKPWINDEWLGDLILYAAYRAGGINGVILFTTAVTCALFLVIFLTARLEGAGAAGTVVMLTAAALCSRPRFSGRPEILTLVFTALFIYLIRKKILTGRSPLYLLPLFQVVWVNVHPGAVFGVVLLIAAAASGIAGARLKAANDGGRGEAFRRALSLVPAAFLCLGACLLNPYGLHGVTAPFKFAGTDVFMKYIAEWAPTTMSALFGLEGPVRFNAFRFLLFAGALSFFVRFRRLDLVRLCLFVLTAAMALKSQRFMAIFSMVAAPMTAAHAAEALRPLRLSRPLRTAGALVLVSALLAAGAYHAVTERVYIEGFGVHWHFPEGAVRFLQRNKGAFREKMYNEYSIGGYLIWRLYPGFRVFIDGRTTLHGRDFYGSMLDFWSAPTPEKWDALAEKYGFDYAVFAFEQKEEAHAVSLSASGWRLVFWDDRALIYVLPAHKFQHLIKKHAYEYVNPYNALHVARVALDEGGGFLDDVRRELARSLDDPALDPNPIALHALGYIEYKLKNYDTAKRVLTTLTRSHKRLAGPYALLGSIYLEEGREDEAQRAFRTAAALDPKFRRTVKKLLK
ncbi:MAG: hypothetical protein AB1742_02755 [bacterium]